MSYILRRLFSGLVIVFALTWITFALFWLLPAEPWRAVVTDPVPTKAEIAAANHKLGVDRPVFVQYGKFVWGIVRHGSFGRDYYQNEPVTTFLKQALPVTWSIVLGGVILLFVLALPLATVSALWANTALDRIILTLTIAGVALHPFIIGIGLRGLFANRLHWLPAYYYCPLRGETQLSTLDPGNFTYKYTTCGGPGGWASHLALPVADVRGHLPAALCPDAPRRARRGDGLGVHPDGACEGRRAAARPPRPRLPERDAPAADDDRDGDRHRADGFDLHRDDVHAPRRGRARDRLARLRIRDGVGRQPARWSAAAVGGAFNLPVLAGVVFMIALTVIVLNIIVDVTYAMLDPRIRLSGRSVEATG